MKIFRGVFIVFALFSFLTTQAWSLSEKEFPRDKLPPQIILESVVVVTSLMPNPSGGAMMYSTGGGVVISSNDKESLILTARHVIKEEQLIRVKTISGESTALGRVVWEHPYFFIDLVSLKAPLTLQPATICSCKKARKGDSVFAISHSVLKSSGKRALWFISEGTIESVGSQILTNAYSSHGGSGGGLFSIDGCLLGIISWAATVITYSRGRGGVFYPPRELVAVEPISDTLTMRELSKIAGESFTCDKKR